MRSAKKISVVPGLGEMPFDPDADLVFDYEQESCPGIRTACNLLPATTAGEVVARRPVLFARWWIYCAQRRAGGSAHSRVSHRCLLQRGARTVGCWPTTNELRYCGTRVSKRAHLAQRRAGREGSRCYLECNAGLYRARTANPRCFARGKMAVVRRAPKLAKALLRSVVTFRALDAMEWVNAYAIAVNEENAAGGRVVTSPTNGAAGIIPGRVEVLRDLRCRR